MRFKSGFHHTFIATKNKAFICYLIWPQMKGFVSKITQLGVQSNPQPRLRVFLFLKCFFKLCNSASDCFENRLIESTIILKNNFLLLGMFFVLKCLLKTF